MTTGKFEDLTGKKFSKLTVIKRVENHVQPNGKTYVRWLCKCECGNEVIVRSIHLKNGHTQSCGCLKKEKVTTHGLKRTRLYTVWRDIKLRCSNPNARNFKDYGGIGITICEEWTDNFKAFYDWAMVNGYDENAPKGECTIDRIDNSKGYYPENCRFVNKFVQANNKRNNRFLTYKGKTHTIAEWSRILNIKPYILYGRLYKGWSVEKILTTSVKKNRNI